MRNTLSNAAQLPFKVAAGLTDEAAHQAEGLWPGFREEAPHDPSQLHHETSGQLRGREQSSAPPTSPSGKGGLQEGACLEAEIRENTGQQSDPAGQLKHDLASNIVKENEISHMGSSASLSHQDTSASLSVSIPRISTTLC